MQLPIQVHRRSRMAIILLLVAILLDRFLVAKIAPWLSAAFAINLIPVVLGIPVNLDFKLGVIPTVIIFSILYSIWISKERKRINVIFPKVKSRPLYWSVLKGFLIIPCCLVLAGMIYQLAHDHLPKTFCNGIESIGLNTDVYYPGMEGPPLHLKGSLIILCALFLGIYFFHLNMQTAERDETSPSGANDQVFEPRLPEGSNLGLQVHKAKVQRKALERHTP